MIINYLPYIIPAIWMLVGLILYFGTALIGFDYDKWAYELDFAFLPNEIGTLAIWWPLNLFLCSIVVSICLCVEPFYFTVKGLARLRNKVLQVRRDAMQRNKVKQEPLQAYIDKFPDNKHRIEKDNSLQEAEKEVEEYLREDKFANVK